jgi:chlorobactene glucosyltransferase
VAEIVVNVLIFVTGILILLCLASYLEARNPPRISVDRAVTVPDRVPRVSVIVPARNEEKNIAPCLESLLEQDYPDFEIIVVDDRSTDGTGDRVDAFCRRDPRVKKVNGEALKPGWLGKSHAAHQGVRQASGEWLLFVDADTRHHPHGLTAAMGHVLRENVDLLSLYPHFVCETFWEKVIQPAVGRMILISGPVDFVNSRKRIFRVFSMAIGQFLLFRRSVYDAVGGHEAIRDRVVEDVELARAVKQAGFHLNFLYGIDVLHTRMYKGFSEMWRGWSRSFYPAMGGNTILAVVQSFLLLVFGTVPYLVFPVTGVLWLAGFGSDPVPFLFGLGLFQYGLLFATTYVVRARLREYPEYFLTCPLGGLMVQWISVHSIYTYALKKKILWKDRNLNA